MRKAMAKDKDIRRLLWWSKSYCVFVLVLVSVFCALCIFCDGFSKFIEEKTRFLWNINNQEYIAASIVFVLYFGGLFFNLLDLKSYSVKLWKGICYLFKRKRPRCPSDLWNAYQGSVSDSQIINTAQSLIHHVEKDYPVAGIYSGVPYFLPIFINAFGFRWHTKGWNWVRRFRRWNFFRKFALQTIFSKADDKVFSDVTKRPLSSNAVFGVLYSSSYFLMEYNRLKKKHEKLKRKNKIRDDASFKIRVYFNLGNSKENRIAKEWMQYVTVPELFEFVSESENMDLEICQLYLGARRGGRPRRGILLPVKRYIVLPDGWDKNQTPFPQNTKKLYNNQTIMLALGGAEHNLALQSVIGYYRWHLDERKGCKVGIAENMFEPIDENDFLVGTEEMVYGITRRILSRDTFGSKNSSRKGTVYCMNLKVDPSCWIKFYGVYGYSAMATKIMGCYTLGNLIKVDMHPWQREIFLNRVVRCANYIVEKDAGNKKIFETDTGRYWDENDLMNHPDLLLKWLKNQKMIDLL